MGASDGYSNVGNSVKLPEQELGEVESFVIGNATVNITGEKVELPSYLITLIHERMHDDTGLLMDNRVYFEYKSKIYTKDGELVVEAKRSY